MERFDDYDWPDKNPSWEEEFDAYIVEQIRRESKQRLVLFLKPKEKREISSWRRGF